MHKFNAEIKENYIFGKNRLKYEKCERRNKLYQISYESDH